MTLNTLRLRALRRAHTEPAHPAQDHSLTYALCLILFLVFAPIIGAHIVFAFFAAPTQAQTVHGTHAPPLATTGERGQS